MKPSIAMKQKGRDQRGLEVSANLMLNEEFEMNLFGCENKGQRYLEVRKKQEVAEMRVPWWKKRGEQRYVLGNAGVEADPDRAGSSIMFPLSSTFLPGSSGSREKCYGTQPSSPW